MMKLNIDQNILLAEKQKSRKASHFLIFELLRYGLVGGLTTIVSLGSYFLLTYLFFDPNNPMELQVVNMLSWVLAVIFSFFANRSVVFRSHSCIIRSVIKFVSARISSLLVEMLFMLITVSVFKMNDRLMKVVVQFIVLAINYIMSKFWVFRSSENVDK